tara:strand:- start:42 stop:311 length:270 start_codon:yes stop_codon:yes gene_type:complete
MNNKKSEINEIEDYEMNIYAQSLFLDDEAFYFSAELAMKDRIEGLSEKEFLMKRMELEYKMPYINWGIAISIFANYLHRIHHINQRSLH